MGKNNVDVSKTINLSVTRLQKSPCLYERGGYNPKTKKGYAIIITDSEGRAKLTIALRQEINNRHALIPVQKGDICLEATKDDRNEALEGQVCVNVWQVNDINVNDDGNGTVLGDAEVVLLNNYCFEAWNKEDDLLKKLEKAIEIVKRKCQTVDCVEALYVQTKFYNKKK